MNNKGSKELYEDYKATMRKIADVKYSSAMLQWDQETYLPPKSADLRGQQIATLTELAHELFANEKVGELLQRLNEASDLSEQEKKNVSLSLEDYNKVKKFSADFVRKMSEAVSESFHAWMKARNENSFAVFEPSLQKLVTLKREEAELLGYSAHPYNALMNDYEKGATVQMVDKVFEDVEPALRQLLDLVNSRPAPDDSFLHQLFPKQQQWEWGVYLAKQLNFDFEAGRKDLSEHPFTINFSSTDVRITTRVDEHDFSNMTWSTIHEVGHALYEQGLPNDQYGLPLGEYASLSIHESQSRLWENCIGRSRAFWDYYYTKVNSHFPAQFAGVNQENFLKAINKVKPSLIRTEADELTYHFHVMVRYRLEKDLIKGNIDVHDIPAYWNEQYQKLLGVNVPDDKNGCLQDVHWSHGSFGYFPTYSLGSFYAAQFWQLAKKDLPGIENELATTGNTLPLLDWLRRNIHEKGRMFTSNEVCEAVTGAPLDSTVFVEYLKNKLKDVYQLPT